MSIVAPRRPIIRATGTDKTVQVEKISDKGLETVELVNSSLNLYKSPSPGMVKSSRLQCHYCQLAKFNCHDFYPVTITNDFDNKELPKTFQFIQKSILSNGVEAAHIEFRSGCDCENDIQCEYNGCSCLDEVEAIGPRYGRNKNKKSHAYVSDGENRGNLRKEMLESRYPIYECHEHCSCSRRCKNRVVQQGRKIPLDIFRTPDGRGWGMCTIFQLFDHH